ncbi:hypothetical protein BU16DRAFT_555873 [Lophium mytilinum]|uniref:Cytochrome c oxidase assembly protein COX20, mitochondrial n=1 Tax=Lophium mytilinum TaxID=390894 RepID=A0A6A6RAC4_9PEZI|nr:hypothetical protein BU16DRAFT_555873 [Lophium mytilinum]
MADDTRQSSPAYPTPKAEDVAKEAARYRTPANTLPGGTANTAGGEKLDDQSLLTKAVKMITWDDWKNIGRMPCAKDSLMTGILSGFVMGGMMGLVGRSVWTACNISVGAFMLSSTGGYTYCQYRRGIERDGLRQVQAVASAKKAEHEEKRRKAIAKRREEERIMKEKLEEERRKSWSYWASRNLKFWGSDR